MEEYVLVAAEEGGEICEVDLESNGTLGLGTVQAMFGEQVTLLQYQNPTTGMLRVVRVSDSAIQAPKGGWGKTVYFGQLEKQETGNGNGNGNGKRERETKTGRGSRRSHVVGIRL